jgi:hypothetical protein
VGVSTHQLNKIMQATYGFKISEIQNKGIVKPKWRLFGHKHTSFPQQKKAWLRGVVPSLQGFQAELDLEALVEPRFQPLMKLL